MVYQHMLRPVERRGEENRLQWGEGSQGKAFGAFHSAYWSFVVVIYFLISFLFSAWGYSWILFIAAGAIESLLKGMMHLKEDKK